MFELVAVAIISYLLGSIPTAYVVARLVKGIDLREFGSGNVGAANIGQAISIWATIGVGAVDFAKGLGAVAIAKGWGLPLEAQVGAGLLAIAGHNWPPFLGFSGGRGITTTAGVLVLLAPRELAIGVAFALAGKLLGNSALFIGVGVLALPLSALAFREPLPLVMGLVGMFVLIVIRRLSAPRRRDIPVTSWRQLLLNRLLFDRDVRRREEWVSWQKPPEKRSSGPTSGSSPQREEGAKGS